MLPVKFFAMRTAEFSAFILFICNHYKFFAFLAAKTAQYFITARIFRDRSFSVIIDLTMMNSSAMHAAVNLTVARRFKTFAAYRTKLIH